MHWNRLHSEVAESPSLEVCNKYGDVALRNMVSRHGGGGLDVVILEVSSLFTDPMTNQTALHSPSGIFQPSLNAPKATLSLLSSASC